MIELRSDQRVTVDKAKKILALYRIVYLAAMMRTGKSIMGITIAYESGWKRILVLTKKDAIKKIQIDVASLNYPISVTVTNFEQAKKLNPSLFDGIIVDEANEAAGAFPKPTQRAQTIQKLVGSKPLILMSGTPNPESPSQIYHQFWLSPYSPFRQYKNFYKWAKVFVKQYEVEVPQEDGTIVKKLQVKQKFVNGFQSNDYSEGISEAIDAVTKPYMVFLSQEEAGFTELVEEEIMFIKIDKNMYKLMDILKEDKVYQMKCGDFIVADTPIKMQSVFHQISSGTIKVGPKKFHIIDESKAWFIKSKFKGKKIAIYYKFLAEFELLKKVFPDWTDDDQEFNEANNLTYLKQMRSGRSGVDLQTADALIMYNIDYSATTYWQGRERMANKNRTKKNKMYWIFSEHGFEMKVHKAVVKKQNYTIRHFKRDVKKWQMPKEESQLLFD